jgi:catechol 2,3-dioxygenase-like lactoylglutathione lyase family enzyme
MDRATDLTQITGITTKVASSVMRVSDLDRSVNFYCDVFSCRVTIHEPDMALLLAPNGFQLYLHSTQRSRRPGVDSRGVEYLMWATDSETELEQITQRLRAHDPATYSHTENGLTFVEGCDPDGGRVIVAYPSPSRLPRELIAARLRGTLRPRPARTLRKKREPRLARRR